MVAALDVGALSYREGGEDRELFVSGGFCEVRGDTVRIVSEAGETPEEIDEARAEAAAERARKRISEARRTAQIDLMRAELALRRATFRLRVRHRI